MKSYIKKFGFGMFLCRILIVTMGIISFGVYTLCVYGLGTGEYQSFAWCGISIASAFGTSSAILWKKLRVEETAFK